MLFSLLTDIKKHSGRAICRPKFFLQQWFGDRTSTAADRLSFYGVIAGKIV